MLTEMTENAGEDIAVVEALLEGSSEPPTEDLTEPAPALVHEDEVIVKGDDIPEMSEHDLIEALATATLDRSERRARSVAFKDRVAEERAREVLGDEFEEIVQAMDGAPKKVGEKVYNALCFIAGRGKLSNYTVIALDRLRDKGALSTGELVKLYMESYGESTARSQTQQMMVALPILKLAERTGDTLKFIDGAMDAKILAAQLAEPVTSAPAPRKSKKADKPVDEEALLAAADAEPEALDPDPEMSDEGVIDLLAAADEEVEQPVVPDILDDEAEADAALLGE